MINTAARNRVSMLLNHLNKPSIMLSQKQTSNMSSTSRRIVRFYASDDEKNNDHDRQSYYGILNGNQDPVIGSTVSLLQYQCIYDPSTYKESSETKVINKLLSPINAVNVFCIGLNYKSHAAESEMNLPSNPVIFAKPTTSIINPFENIIIPSSCIKGKNDDNPGEMDYEVELVIVIGKKCKNIKEEDALKYILGYSIANDVSARKWQLDKEKSGGQWIRGKSFDTFCPFGPCILLENGNDIGQNLNLWTELNGKKLQNSNTNKMIFPIKKLVSFLSQSTTLLPGTIILSGTPEGIGFARKPPIWLKDGDKVTVAIEGIGQLTNNVKDE